MSDWLGLAFFVLVIVLVLVASARLGSPPKQISVEDFEKRAREGGFTRAGMFGLQQLLHPKAVKAIEVQQDLRHGYYNKKRVPGEGDDKEVEGDDDEVHPIKIDPNDVQPGNEGSSAALSEEKDA
jgi:hypothetical protein